MRQDRRGEEAGRRQAVSRALRAVTRVLTDALWLLLGEQKAGFPRATMGPGPRWRPWGLAGKRFVVSGSSC